MNDALNIIHRNFFNESRNYKENIKGDFTNTRDLARRAIDAAYEAGRTSMVEKTDLMLSNARLELLALAKAFEV